MAGVVIGRHAMIMAFNRCRPCRAVRCVPRAVFICSLGTPFGETLCLCTRRIFAFFPRRLCRMACVFGARLIAPRRRLTRTSLHALLTIEERIFQIVVRPARQIRHVFDVRGGCGGIKKLGVSMTAVLARAGQLVEFVARRSARDGIIKTIAKAHTHRRVGPCSRTMRVPTSPALAPPRLLTAIGCIPPAVMRSRTMWCRQTAHMPAGPAAKQTLQKALCLGRPGHGREGQGDITRAAERNHQAQNTKHRTKTSAVWTTPYIDPQLGSTHGVLPGPSRCISSSQTMFERLVCFRRNRASNSRRDHKCVKAR